MSKRLGAILLAIGSGLGVWVITNLSDTGITDYLIVLLFLIAGATLTNWKRDDD